MASTDNIQTGTYIDPPELIYGTSLRLPKTFYTTTDTGSSPNQFHSSASRDTVAVATYTYLNAIDAQGLQ